MKLQAYLLLPALLLGSALSQAYEVRLSEQQMQQELDARMPVTRQQGMFILTLSEPQLALLSEQQRISIHSKALINTTLGLQGNGRVTVNGKVRYEPSDYSFYIDDPQVTAISIDGLSPSLEPQLINLAQQALQPALEGQPVYTLSDQDMSESMARMMLKSMTIDGSDMVLELSPF
ncbi:MAG: DUF1439 domain-containing protein [Pseudomonadota bacterium]|nr:DUF1439 domain-containing protein [Pseudomonadota bacterium]